MTMAADDFGICIGGYMYKGLWEKTKGCLRKKDELTVSS